MTFSVKRTEYIHNDYTDGRTTNGQITHQFHLQDRSTADSQTQLGVVTVTTSDSQPVGLVEIQDTLLQVNLQR